METNATLTNSALGAVILIQSGAIAVMWREIKRLNDLRIGDMKEIGDANRAIIGSNTRALTNLIRKIDGIGKKNDKT